MESKVQKLHHPHDKLVSKFMESPQVAGSFFAHHLPTPVLEKLDMQTLKPSKDSAVTSRWKKLCNDVVFTCQTKAHQLAYLYLLLEHASTPDPLLPVRILRYQCNIWGKYLDRKGKERPTKLPNIISMVLYHGRGTYPHPTDLMACFQDPTLAKVSMLHPFHLVDLCKLSEEALAKDEAATVMQFLLKYSHRRDFIARIQKLMALRPLLWLDLSESQLAFTFAYILNQGEGTPTDVTTMREAFTTIYGTARTEGAMTLAEALRQEGRQEGRQEQGMTMARRLLIEGMDKCFVSKVTGLPLTKLERL